VQNFGRKGQKFPSCPGTKGQRDKLKFFPWDGTAEQLYRGFLLEVPIFRKKSDFCGCVRSKTGKGCPKQEKDVQKQDKDVLKQEKEVLKLEMNI